MNARQPEGPKPPKPRTGFIVVCPGWDPDETPADGWTLLTLKEARSSRDFAELVKSGRTVILQATTTYRVVEDGDRG